MTSGFLRPAARPNKVSALPSSTPEIQGLAERFRANAFKRPDCDERKGTGVAYDLERMCPEALDLDALAKAHQHVEVNGHSPELAGNRGETYFRDQLRSLRVMTTDDVCRLVFQGPHVVVAWLRPILQTLARLVPDLVAGLLAEVAPLVGKTVEDLPASPAQLQEAFARSAREFSDVAGAMVEAGADGQYTPAELERIVREAHEQKEAAARVEASAIALLHKGGRS